MKNRLWFGMSIAMLTLVAAWAWLPVTATAQDAKGGGAAAKKRERASPHEEVAATVGEHRVTISYGRPYKKGRAIFGGLEPWGKVWRTGADEATTFTTTGDVMLGDLHVPAGTYGLFTVPGEREWTLVINKVAKQWGAFKYDQAMDLGRTAMKVEREVRPAVEQLTISIEKKGERAGVLKIAWDDTVATVPLMAH